ncbi:hypothetical protein CC1G_04735 [Coprinopsis cinerea okayama7|uniref:Uncharacterized protein n=1 Tax=Coprinopsis cinerea (strain Okayama-7 / 130 / ATCC MYA-4618 / FGSC 9003) TaxID=240176 RepID=A8P2D2_COPC7|nr:hypothetical protein CC1G_04735 [Coprinopsis cinerea okayama7\|eukprot:XP_001838291.2 hypothetical protein CC1G_04735 [Coprinopsis cinerea okayama7\
MHVNELPSEVLAAAFELGVLTTGIRFLPPVCLVCRTWYLLINETPRLWGIIDVSRTAKPDLLLAQVDKAKAAPLTVFVSETYTVLGKRRNFDVIDRLSNLSCNWIKADVPRWVFSQREWPTDYPNLEELVIFSGRLALPTQSDSSSQSTPPSSNKLRSLVIDGVTNSGQFLSPSIQAFTLKGRGSSPPVSDTLAQLSQIPNVRRLKIDGLCHRPQLLNQSLTVTLAHLREMELTGLRYLSILLLYLAAPNLHVLTIDNTSIRNHRPWWWMNQPGLDNGPDQEWTLLTPFFTQWCEPRFTPSNLHTLKLVNCLIPSDLPFLVRFLARTPNLVRLILVDEVIAGIPSALSGLEESDEGGRAGILDALKSPTAAMSAGGGWLCPSLMVLHIESKELETKDLIDVAAIRGVRSPVDCGLSQSAPKKLRTITGFICAGAEGELARLESLVDTACCTCLGCDMNTLARE